MIRILEMLYSVSERDSDFEYRNKLLLGIGHLSAGIEYEPYHQRAPKTGDQLYDADEVVDEER